MNRVTLLFYLLLMPTFIVAMEDENENQIASVPGSPLFVKKDKGSKDSPIQARKNNSPYAHVASGSSHAVPLSSIAGVSFEDIDEVWKNAPGTVKNWAAELKEQNGFFKSTPYRLVLYGVPGVGKTTLGLGIWKNNADWDLQIISGGELILKHRGAVAEALRKRLTNIKTYQKTIVIIDESHLLMESPCSGSPDTSETTKTLESFLDQQAENRQTMVILTNSSIKDMKESMKHRLFRFGVEVLPPSKKELQEMFHYYANAEELNVEEIKLKDLGAAYKRGNIKVGRDVKLFASLLKEQIRDSGYEGSLEEYQLKGKFLLEVAKNFKKRAEAFEVGQRRLSDREFQQKIHDNAKWHQAKLAALTTVIGPLLYYAVNKIGTELTSKAVKTPREGNGQGATDHEQNVFVKKVIACAQRIRHGGSALAAKATAFREDIPVLHARIIATASDAATKIKVLAAAHSSRVIGACAVAGAGSIGGVLYYVLSKNNESSSEQ